MRLRRRIAAARLPRAFGAWRSLVARTVRVGEVPGSNPGAPIFSGAGLGPARARTVSRPPSRPPNAGFVACLPERTPPTRSGLAHTRDPRVPGRLDLSHPGAQSP